MRHQKFEAGRNPPFIRPPKYTGITLSLLSIFVLVSMLAVWEKMAHVPSVPTLQILAWDRCELPLEKVRKIYQTEARCIVTVQYEAQQKIMERIKQTDEWDILIIPDSQELAETLHNGQWSNRGVIAYSKSSLPPSSLNQESNRSTPLFGFLKTSHKESAPAHSFLRYLQAPTKGQVEFALEGWTGVSEDHWDQSPKLKIYSTQESKSWIDSIAQDFAKREGLELTISFMEKESLEASVQLLIQANNRNYFPDLVGLPHALIAPTWIATHYYKFEGTLQETQPDFSFYIYKQSPLIRTCNRFLDHLSKNK
jgi:hypothetical protein